MVAAKIIAGLQADSALTNLYTVGGTGATVTLTQKSNTGNDATLNIAIANGTCTGLTAAPTSTITTPGVLATNNFLTIPWSKFNPNPKDASTDDSTSANRVNGVNWLSTLVTGRGMEYAVETERMLDETLTTPALMAALGRIYALAQLTGFAARTTFLVFFPEGGGIGFAGQIKNLKSYGGDYTGKAGFSFTIEQCGPPYVLA
jgi:hypothetical protein